MYGRTLVEIHPALPSARCAGKGNNHLLLLHIPSLSLTMERDVEQSEDRVRQGCAPAYLPAQIYGRSKKLSFLNAPTLAGEIVSSI